ncbi:MAG: phosphoribosylaminoimidazolecarboxamide formyltransferase, partial [Planctomycetota bacterium]
MAVDLPPDLAKAYEVEGRELTPAATAYVRARGSDPKSSFGDFVALSDVVDEATARFLKGVISDGIVAPGYGAAAFEILKGKKGGKFIVMQADPDFVPPAVEAREVFGMRLAQDRNNVAVTPAHLDDVVRGTLTDAARRFTITDDVDLDL